MRVTFCARFSYQSTTAVIVILPLPAPILVALVIRISRVKGDRQFVVRDIVHTGVVAPLAI